MRKARPAGSRASQQRPHLLRLVEALLAVVQSVVCRRSPALICDRATGVAASTRNTAATKLLGCRQAGHARRGRPLDQDRGGGVVSLHQFDDEAAACVDLAGGQRGYVAHWGSRFSSTGWVDLLGLVGVCPPARPLRSTVVDLGDAYAGTHWVHGTVTNGHRFSTLPNGVGPSQDHFPTVPNASHAVVFRPLKAVARVRIPSGLPLTPGCLSSGRRIADSGHDHLVRPGCSITA